MKLHSIAAAFILILVASCRQPSGKAGPDALSVEFRHQLTGADSSWNVMMNSDDGKIQNMDRLVAELLLVEGCDSSVVLEIKSGISGLKALRYTQRNVREPGRIDRYDSVCTALISALKQEVSRNPKAVEFQLINQLVNEVSIADDSVLFYRKEYDRFADRLNLSLKKNRKKLQGDFTELDSISAFPVFRLVP